MKKESQKNQESELPVLIVGNKAYFVKKEGNTTIITVKVLNHLNHFHSGK